MIAAWSPGSSSPTPPSGAPVVRDWAVPALTFEPGARSNWHSHPLGQLLIVTAGRGLIQDEGGRVHTIRTGDTIWTAPGVLHWHGAAPDSAVTHVAVSESVDGSAVAWREAVSSAQYAAPPVD